MEDSALRTEVRYLKGVGPARSGQLSRLGIGTVADLLLCVPRSYLDRRHMTPVRDLVPGKEANVSGRIVSSRLAGSGRGGRKRFQAALSDGTGEIVLTFFNYRYARSRLLPGTGVIASGRTVFYGKVSMVHPELIFTDEDHPKGGLVLPVYPLTAGMTQATMRKIVSAALRDHTGDIPEILPPEVLASMGWKSRRETIHSVHFPADPEEGERARRTLALEELFIHQSLLHHVRSRASRKRSFAISPPEGCLEELFAKVPFSLTSAQERAVVTVRKGLEGTTPMRMLLQGDVGSGKTVVAVAACMLCCRGGYQAVVVAPTEVLASQHYRSMSSLLEQCGVRCGLLTGGTGPAARRMVHASLADGTMQVLIGTHAVLREEVSVPRMGLCVIDEQHKFGVEQRDSLLSGRDPAPHFMLMSATPIPRTLAMAVYGDLDLTVLDEMPPGRGKTETRVVDRELRSEVYRFLLDRLERGERAYIVYPLREASEELDLRDASSSFQILRKGPMGAHGVGLLTGAMRSAEKLEVTGRFVSGSISVLVSTTVVEVGLDVPEATVMVIAHADRFGLSQLHQLRGRIGRGGRDAWCFLMTDSTCGEEGLKRIGAMTATGDGFRIAEQDLMLRGPGDVAGTRQHGIPSFRIASLVEDADLLDRASRLAASADSWPSLREEYICRFGSEDVPEL